jgi:hypothetical protein
VAMVPQIRPCPRASDQRQRLDGHLLLRPYVPVLDHCIGRAPNVLVHDQNHIPAPIGVCQSCASVGK